MKLKKAYVEITDVCNLKCSFCHGTKRAPAFMQPEDFRTAAEKVRPLTQYIYLHLMGEPLLHPELPEILTICSELDFKVTVTTNGILLPEKAGLLKGIYKISVSVHAFEANNLGISLEQYITGISDAVRLCADSGTLCALRLWNKGGKDSLNSRIEEMLFSAFPGEYKENRRGLTLRQNVFLEYGEKFDWPDINADETGTRFCMGLRDQAGVLCDGTIVPCCLDADGEIALGNIFTDSFEAVLESERARAIIDGFSCGQATEELCKKCGFAAERFR